MMLRFFVNGVKRQLESNPTAPTRKKILPGCKTPDLFCPRDVSDEVKIQAVLSEPCFGMFSLLHYHWHTGHMLETFERDNRVYCSRVFGTCLPLLMQVCQWLMYCALLTHQIRANPHDSICPNQAQVEHKIMMAAIALLYFIRSFFLWDQLVDRTNRQPVVSAWYTIFDAVHEFSFTLCIYCSNLALTFTEPDMINMILNALALGECRSSSYVYGFSTPPHFFPLLSPRKKSTSVCWTTKWKNCTSNSHPRRPWRSTTRTSKRLKPSPVCITSAACRGS